MLVKVEGVFMGANVKTSTFEGNSKSAVYIDVYQKDSPGDKSLAIKSDDVELLNKLSKDYTLGSIFSCNAIVSAYKNKAYLKLLQLT